MPSSRQHKTSVDHGNADSSSDDEHYRQKPNRPRGYRPHVQREDSLVKREAESDKVDSGWDTDYDPKDKYYLSADDDPFDLYSPESKRSTKDEPSRDRRSPSKGRTSDRPRAPSHAHSHARSRHHHHSHHRSHSPSGPREDRDASASKHKDHSRSKPSSSSHASHSRPKASRAGSSYLGGSARPRMSRAGSSYAGSRSARPRSAARALSHGPSGQGRHHMRHPRDLAKLLDPETLHRLLEDFPWEDAGKVALQAGTVAAIKVGTDSAPWAVKGTKIASAALGAAVVDHVFRPKKKGGIKYSAMRHMAEVALSSMVVGPALGKASGGGGGRSSRGKR